MRIVLVCVGKFHDKKKEAGETDEADADVMPIEPQCDEKHQIVLLARTPSIARVKIRRGSKKRNHKSDLQMLLVILCYCLLFPEIVAAVGCPPSGG